MSKRNAREVVIDPDGDIILELSEYTWMDETDVHVSSKILALASPVFSKMLNSQFKEGLKNRSSCEKLRISLPDDRPNALIMVCKVIHHRGKEIRTWPGSDTLLDIATICDKYDCKEILQPWALRWLQIDYKSKWVTDLKTYLITAYILDCAEAFSKISWILLLRPQVYKMDDVVDHPLVDSNIIGT